MFCERNKFGDIDSIIHQFEAHPATNPEDHEEDRLPSIILTRQRGQHPQRRLPAQARIKNCELKVLRGWTRLHIEQPLAVHRHMIDS